MGEKDSEPFQITFNGFLKVAFQGLRVTSDTGLILVRALDERLGLEAARPADAVRHVVAEQPPATPRQHGWTAGRAPPDPKPVRVYAPTDLGPAGGVFVGWKSGRHGEDSR